MHVHPLSSCQFVDRRLEMSSGLEQISFIYFMPFLGRVVYLPRPLGTCKRCPTPWRGFDPSLVVFCRIDASNNLVGWEKSLRQPTGDIPLPRLAFWYLWYISWFQGALEASSILGFASPHTNFNALPSSSRRNLSSYLDTAFAGMRHRTLSA